MTNLLTSWNCKNESHLVIGSSNACGLRIRAIIEAGATPTLITNGVEIDELPLIIKTIIEESGDKETLKILSQELDFSHILTLGRKEIDGVFDKVFVSLPLADYELKKNIYEFCLKNRIPINTSDSPEFCTFTILSTYSQGDFQVGVTTNGKGCKLASRIKREIVSSLPVNIGEICSKVGQLRERIQQEDCAQQDQIGEHDEDAITTSKINSLVEEFKMTQEQVKLQRTRWLSQVVEYYPLNTLASVSIDDLTREFKATKTTTTSIASDSPASHKAGSISLVGSGPGSVSLLTVGAIEEIFSADLILADKLVPQQVLDIIPQNRTNLFIAKKFPGNAERAQEELLNLGLEALQRGKRLLD